MQPSGIVVQNPGHSGGLAKIAITEPRNRHDATEVASSAPGTTVAT
jgi:hypothetical protein